MTIDENEERIRNKTIQRISGALDREAGIPTPSDAPRLIELLGLDDSGRVELIDNSNDYSNNTVKRLKKQKEHYLGD
jgi:hypothetical protein